MIRCSGEHFYIPSPNRIIQNAAHAQSVDYLRVGRSTFRHVILITRIPWVRIRVHHARRTHRGQVPERTPDCPEPKTFNTFSNKKHITIPMTREEIETDLALRIWRFHGESVRSSLTRERFVSWNCKQSPALLRFMYENNTAEQATSRKTV